METAILRRNDDTTNHICFGCNQSIRDEYVSNVLDHLWHENCIRCSECQIILHEKCFTRNMKLYCKPDFYRLFGVKCSGCEEGIYPSDLVRRIASRIFHKSCLKCYQCDKEVATGDQLYVIGDGSLVCKADYESISKGEIKIRERKTPSQMSETDLDLDEKPPSTSSNGGGEQQITDDEDDVNRRRGPRTTIKAKQLEVLKSAFMSTPKPSRHIREKLAQETGLTMRVIQVWFQNRRSKERRVKQLSVQDVRRGFRKNSMSKEHSNEMSFFFPNGAPATPGLDDYQQNFNFDVYNNNSNNNNNNVPLSLPDTTILQNTQNAMMKSKFSGESTEFNMIDSFASQLQSNNFHGFNAMNTFTPPLMTTYE